MEAILVDADHYGLRPNTISIKEAEAISSCGSIEKMREAETICVRHEIQFQSVKKSYNKLSILYSDRAAWVRCSRRPLLFLIEAVSGLYGLHFSSRVRLAWGLRAWLHDG